MCHNSSQSEAVMKALM